MTYAPHKKSPRGVDPAVIAPLPRRFRIVEAYQPINTPPKLEKVKPLLRGSDHG
jgi:hypothetical protein